MIKTIFTFTALLLFIGYTTVRAQSFLKESANRLGISVKIPPEYEVTETEKPFYPTEISNSNLIPNIAQAYQQEPVKGDTFFNVFFGTVTSVLKHKSDECVVIVYIPPGRGGSNYGEIATDSAMLRTFKHIAFERIKSNFNYGSAFHAPSELDAMEIYSMLTHYPVEKARQMFNAGAMVGYPLNFEGNVFQERFTRGRAVVVGKDHREFYLYFMMTDASVLLFDKYLGDFNKMLNFHNDL
ncbi:hypothetical protein [Gaoshiqia sp. Z1-71]|uniref:hypothetical protein n=1 Tax=Gaoshiqia hydrogeniformans TaxID=3290090 RepID=UPI003BF7F76F